MSLAWALACASDLDFGGIEAVEADGDTLIVTWAPATGSEVRYTVVATPDDGDGSEAETGDTSAALAGLADGRYTVTVNASDGRSEVAGGSLVQRVGSRFVEIDGVDVRGEAMLATDGAFAVLGAVATHDAPLAVVDLAAMEVVATIDDLRWDHLRAVALADEHVFVGFDPPVGVEDPDESVGLAVYAVADGARVGELGSAYYPVHSLSYDDGVLCAVSGQPARVVAIDVADPAAPFELAAWEADADRPAHDVVCRDGIAWTALGNYGAAVVEPPELVRDVELGGEYVHNLTPALGGDMLLTASEAVGGLVELWDLRDGEERLADLATVEVEQIHRLAERDQSAFLSLLHDGLVAIELDDPTTDVEAWGATKYSGGTTGVFAAWPVGDHLVVGHAERGLVVLDYWPPVVRTE